MTDKLIPSPEYSPLSPEDSEIANTYLETMDVFKTSEILGISPHKVTEYINKPVVKQYLTEVFLNTGYRNRLKLGKVLDDIVDKKLLELEEAGLTSSKDILEILNTIAKIRQEELKLAIKLEEVRLGKPKRQTNIQINSANPYQDFMEKLIDIDQL